VIRAGFSQEADSRLTHWRALLMVCDESHSPFRWTS
jgi:hypothetical protein